MNINPKVEPWLRALLDGVENSNHRAETTATAAFAVPALVRALEAAEKYVEGAWLASGDNDTGQERDRNAVRAALALSRGETP